MLKKRLSPGRLKKKKVIRHKVKVRVKVRRKLFKKIAGALMGIFLIGALLFSLKIFYGFASGKIKSGVFSTEVKSLNIEVGNKRVNREVLKLFACKIGSSWNDNLKKDIEKEFLSKYPYVHSVRVSKNILTGKVIISGKLEKIVSKITLNTKEFYLALSGRVFSSVYEEAVNQDFIHAEIFTKKKPELRVFAEFVNKINLSEKLFKLKPTLIKYDLDGEKCGIVLEDNSIVNWGGFERTDLKILRLNRVLGDIVGKIPAPHSVDLKHFTIGKIFISEL
ncbi:MAG: hypothetical protein KAR84_03255 [Elusimicrobiales bacterium]|nr:hypothetical protein [Elusimicrobiales bacterium]